MSGSGSDLLANGSESCAEHQQADCYQQQVKRTVSGDWEAV